MKMAAEVAAVCAAVKANAEADQQNAQEIKTKTSLYEFRVMARALPANLCIEHAFTIMNHRHDPNSWIVTNVKAARPIYDFLPDDSKRKIRIFMECQSVVRQCKSVVCVEGGTYTGEWKDSKRHGQGTRKWADGATYTGEWKDGKQHGQGTGKGADGGTYTGEWKDDKPHGQFHRGVEGR